MKTDDRQLAQTIRNAMPADPQAPSFADAYAAASQQVGRRRHRLHLLAAAAVAAIAVIVIVDTRPGVTEPGYIEMAELMETTSWTAPSDALLPDSRFDIYQDLPTLMKSTDGNGGALL